MPWSLWRGVVGIGVVKCVGMSAVVPLLVLKEELCRIDGQAGIARTSFFVDLVVVLLRECCMRWNWGREGSFLSFEEPAAKMTSREQRLLNVNMSHVLYFATYRKWFQHLR